MHLRDNSDVGKGGRLSDERRRRAHATQTAWAGVGGVTT